MNLTGPFYKVTGDKGGSINGGTGRWQPGKWRTVKGELEPCRRGLHLARRQDLVLWLGPAIWLPRSQMTRIAIDPALRGRATPSVLVRLVRAGFRVHRVGRAAYVHDASGRHGWLLVVGPAPDLEARIDAHHRYLTGRGPATPLQERRQAAWLAIRRRLRLRLPNGRFACRVPWWAAIDAVGRLLTPRELQPWRVG